MNIKFPCNCPSKNGKLTKVSYDSLLFEGIQKANKENKAQAVCFHNGAITIMNKIVADYVGAKIYAIIPVPIYSLNDIEHIINPL